MKKILSFTLTLLMLLLAVFPSYAANYDDQVMPCYNNTATTSFAFDFDEWGVGTIEFTCIGYYNVTTGITVETKIQKLNIRTYEWEDLDGGHWIVSTTNYYISDSHLYQVMDIGTYRALVTFTTSGTGGADDVYTQELIREFTNRIYGK